MGQLTIRLLDATTGTPAPNVKISLETETPDGGWRPVGRGVTNDAGQVALERVAGGAASRLLGAPATRYRLNCDVGVYFARTGAPGVFPEIWIHFADDGLAATPGLRVEIGPRAYTVTREQ